MSLTPHVASAYSLNSVNSLLSSYNISSSVTNSLVPLNFSYAGKAYIGMYQSSTLKFMINVTGTYSVVLNATTIYDIIKDYTQTLAFSQANFTGLSGQMLKYQQSGAGAINDCLSQTGLSSGTTCNLTNYCASCQFIPNCKKVLDATHGAAGIFGKGIANFGTQYDALNASFIAFYNAISGINKSNALLRLASINSSFLSIKNITQSIHMNAIFPPTADITPNVLAGCSSYVSESSAPWYCTSLGYCASVDYKSAFLTNVTLLLNKINTLPISSAQVFAIANATSNNEMNYLYPVLSQSKLEELNEILNKTTPNYLTVVNNSAILLTHISDSALSSSVMAIRSTYSYLIASYFTANLIQANLTLAEQYANLTTAYKRVNATYSYLISTAMNNTAKILELQLSGKTSSELGSLALAELTLNNAVTLQNITNSTPTRNQLMAIASKLASFSTYPISLTEIARAIDGPFIRTMGHGVLGLGYLGGVALAPLLGTFLSLIIGMLMIVALMFFKSYMKLHHKIAVNPRTHKHWRFVFILVGALIVVYLAITFILLSYANGSAPFGAFESAYASSKFVVIAVNGTPTISQYTCASKLSATALAQNKQSVIASFSGTTCKVGNATSTVDSCMSFYAGSNIPVIILTTSATSRMSLYSLYGTVLSASGNDAQMNSCYVSLMTK